MCRSWVQPFLILHWFLCSSLLHVSFWVVLLTGNLWWLVDGWCQITFVDFASQVVKAFVVLSPTFSSTDLESLTCDLQEHVKKTTAPYKYPRKVNASEEKLQTRAPFHKSQENYYLDFHDSPERDSGKHSARALAPENLSWIMLVYFVFHVFE